MQLSSEVAERSRNMVADCGLDTLSIFIRDRRAADRDDLSYLYHHGICQEAQEAYRTGRVFEDDPFTRGVAASDR